MEQNLTVVFPETNHSISPWELARSLKVDHYNIYALSPLSEEHDLRWDNFIVVATVIKSSMQVGIKDL